MKNAYIYIRVSTDEQATEGYSIDNQKRACFEYGKTMGYKISRVFSDDGRSGRTMDRPAFQELLKCVKNESLQQVEAVIIYKIDRFARNVGDFSNIRKQFKDAKIKLLSVTENGDVTEGLIGNIFASVAEWESDVNGQRTRDALMQKFRDGWQPTPPPLGYRSVGGERERKKCEPDPYTAPIIRELFHLYATGDYSIIGIQDWLASKNIVSRSGTGLGHSVICNILNNPFYYGLMRWKGESKIGNHEPIISQSLFTTCQYVLAKHRDFLTRRRVHSFLLRGFIYCGKCGQRYTAEWHVDEVKLKKRGGKIAYYHCQKMGRNGCSAPYVEVSEMEKQVEEMMTGIKYSDKFVEAIVGKVSQKLIDSRNGADSKKQGILNKKMALEQTRNVLEDRLIDGTIDNEIFKRKHEEIKQKIQNLEEGMGEVNNSLQMDVDTIEKVLSFTRSIGTLYKVANYTLRRHYLRFFFEKIMVVNKVISGVEYTPFMKALFAANQVIVRKNWLPLKDLFINREIEFVHSLDQTRAYFELLGVVPRETISMTA